MRKETSNQFTEGLVSDLNPITTPNTVLTDNLNGTIITYNGNEFSLQNDQGNYELKHCRLKPNYIPVGIKEYGDILYIISYNPLDKHVEIGSYPSPLQVNEVEPNNTDAELVSIIDSEILNKGLLEKDYSELVKKEQQVIFNGDEFKMYPGDEYYFQTDNIDSPYYYEKFEYFILDEESNLHDITPEIQYGQSDPIFSDYKYVSWRIPGWLIAKARLARLSSAGMNIRSFYAPLVDVTTNTRTVFYDFNFRLNIEDYILKDAESKYRFLWEKNIGFKVIFTAESPEGNIVNINGKDEYIIESFEPSYSEWYSDNYILWFSVKGQFDISGDSVIKVTLIPELTQYNDNKPLYTVVYNNLSQTEIFDLKKVNDKPWSVGESIYKFYLNNDSVQQLEIDVTGPNVASGYVSLQYQILTTDGESAVEWTNCNDYYGIGNNYITILFTDKFEKESVYIIQFRFVEDGVVIKTTPKRILFTTELLNGSENFIIYDRDMSLDYLLELYFNKYSTKMDISNLSILEFNVNVLDQTLSSFFNKNILYNTFIDSSTTFNQNIDLETELDLSVQFDLELKKEGLVGSLWQSIIKNTNVSLDEIPLYFGTNTVDLSINNKLIGEILPNQSLEFYKNNKPSFLDRTIDDLQLNIELSAGRYLDYSFYRNSELIYQNWLDYIDSMHADEILMWPFDLINKSENVRYFDTLPCYKIKTTIKPPINLVTETIENADTSISFDAIVFPGYNAYYVEMNRISMDDFLAKFYIVSDRDAKMNTYISYYLNNPDLNNEINMSLDIFSIIDESWLKMIQDTNKDLLYINCLQHKNASVLKHTFIYNLSADYSELLLQNLSHTSKIISDSQCDKWLNSLVYQNWIKNGTLTGIYTEENGFYKDFAQSLNEGLLNSINNKENFYITYQPSERLYLCYDVDLPEPFGGIFGHKIIL